MTPQSEQILREALGLPPTDRAELVEQILASFAVMAISSPGILPGDLTDKGFEAIA